MNKSRLWKTWVIPSSEPRALNAMNNLELWMVSKFIQNLKVVDDMNDSGEFGDLDIKYLKQNISKCRSQISGSFRRTPRHCAKWLRNSSVETPSFPIRRQALDVKYPEKVERRPDRIPDVRYPDGMSAEKNSRCDTSRWNERCHTSQGGRLRVQGVGTPSPDDTERASLSEQLHPDSLRGYVARSPIQTPLGRSTRHSQSSHLDDSISYLDMLSGSLAKLRVVDDMNDIRSCAQGSRCDEHLRVVNGMNYSRSSALGPKSYEQLKVVDDMKDSRSFTQGYRCYEQLKFVDGMNGSKS
uniref:Uncharacterized protein n=1 Tax=Vitis vinifera TaxID=29760 RepID=A5C0W9_VITVI|nr:hypothetical protein VITISV_035250 [Vitis vinifera]